MPQSKKGNKKGSCFAGFSACGGPQKRHFPFRRSAIPAERFYITGTKFPVYKRKAPPKGAQTQASVPDRNLFSLSSECCGGMFRIPLKENPVSVPVQLFLASEHFLGVSAAFLFSSPCVSPGAGAVQEAGSLPGLILLLSSANSSVRPGSPYLRVHFLHIS